MRDAVIARKVADELSYGSLQMVLSICKAFFLEGCCCRGLPIVGTESRNRNVAQKGHVSLNDILEKLFGRGGRLSKGAMVALGHAFREAEVICPLHVDVLEAQRS
jgi:hypothetical protein